MVSGIAKGMMSKKVLGFTNRLSFGLGKKYTSLPNPAITFSEKEPQQHNYPVDRYFLATSCSKGIALYAGYKK